MVDGTGAVTSVGQKEIKAGGIKGLENIRRLRSHFAQTLNVPRDVRLGLSLVAALPASSLNLGNRRPGATCSSGWAGFRYRLGGNLRELSLREKPLDF